MSDDNPSITAAGSGKSEVEIAFELVSKLKGQGVWGERNQTDILDMYAECLDAVKGLRKYEGQNRVDAPINASAKTSVTPTQSAPQTQAAAPNPAQQQQLAQQQAAQMQAQRQAQLQQQHAQQPVHAQQQALQQVYKGS